MIQQNIDFCNYLRPIVNSCLGYTKISGGYMYHYPGTLIAMSVEEIMFVCIRLPVVFNVYLSCYISDFMSNDMKEPEAQSNMYNNLYFTGYNMKRDRMIELERYFNQIESTNPIYYEPDVLTIPKFAELSSSSEINFTNVSSGNTNFIIPVSKTITPISKGDSSKMFIYNTDRQIRTCVVKYVTHKKKFNLDINTYSSILIV